MTHMGSIKAGVETSKQLLVFSGRLYKYEAAQRFSDLILKPRSCGPRKLDPVDVNARLGSTEALLGVLVMFQLLSFFGHRQVRFPGNMKCSNIGLQLVVNRFHYFLSGSAMIGNRKV